MNEGRIDYGIIFDAFSAYAQRKGLESRDPNRETEGYFAIRDKFPEEWEELRFGRVFSIEVYRALTRVYREAYPAFTKFEKKFWQSKKVDMKIFYTRFTQAKHIAHAVPTVETLRTGLRDGRRRLKKFFRKGR